MERDSKSVMVEAGWSEGALLGSSMALEGSAALGSVRKVLVMESVLLCLFTAMVCASLGGIWGISIRGDVRRALLARFFAVVALAGGIVLLYTLQMVLDSIAGVGWYNKDDGRKNVRRSCNVHAVELSFEWKHVLVVRFDKFLIITRDHLDAQNHKVVDTVVHTRQICIALIVIRAV
jgi:hypothetical protein